MRLFLAPTDHTVAVATVLLVVYLVSSLALLGTSCPAYFGPLEEVATTVGDAEETVVD